MVYDLEAIEVGRRYIRMMAEGQVGNRIAENEKISHSRFWRAVRLARDADRPDPPDPGQSTRLYDADGRADYTYLTAREIRELHVYRDEILRADRAAIRREELEAAESLHDYLGP